MTVVNVYIRKRKDWSPMADCPKEKADSAARIHPTLNNFPAIESSFSSV